MAGGPWILRARAQGGPVKIGLVLPYTGVYAELGNSITQAMELVFARENWTVAGRKIEMIKEDDEMKPPVGVRKTEKLIDSDKVDILTGPVHSGILMGMRDKVHNSKTILIVSNAGADAISRDRCSKWIFRTSFSNWQPCQPMGGWVAKNVSKEVFQIAPNYQAGKDMMEAFRETYLRPAARSSRKTTRSSGRPTTPRTSRRSSSPAPRRCSPSSPARTP